MPAGTETGVMALLGSILGIVAVLVGLAILVLVLALVVDIARWVRNPEENSGLPE